MTASQISCFQCGFENDDPSRFCGACGIGVDVPRCGGCAGLRPPSARFCPQCGMAVPKEEMETAAAFAGEQLRTATMLFASVDGLARLVEEEDPEEVKEILDRLFALLTQQVIKNGGTLDKVMVDSVMALFGVPMAHEDDPYRSVRAAQDMLKALEDFNRALFESRGLSLSLKVGINTGKVLMGYVGSEEGRDFTVLGDAVNIASRLKAAAPPGGALIAHNTRKLLGDRFLFRRWDPISLKGKQESVKVYEVLEGEGASEGDLAEEAPLVGRTEELDTLLGLWRDVELRKEVRWVSVTGELGLGKKRLYEEFAGVVRRSMPTPKVIELRGVASHGGQATDLLRQLVHRLAGVEKGDSPAVEWAKLRELCQILSLDKLNTNADEVALSLAAIAHLGGRSESSNSAVRVDQRFEPLMDLIAEVSRHQPLLISVLNLHEADNQTLNFMEDLASNLPERPVMILGMGRSGLFFARRPNWGKMTERHHLLEMRPLSLFQTRELLTHLMGDSRRLPANWVERMHSFTGGNPYYITETVRSIHEQQGLYLVGRAPAQPKLHVPESIESVIQSRLDRLSFEEGLTLRAAAVVGQVFWRGAVVALLGSERGASLERLVERGFIIPQTHGGLQGEEAYSFSHRLLAEVAYDNLLSQVRSRYHRATAEWLKARLGAGPGPYRIHLALHLERGGEAEQAARAYQQAGLFSAGRFEFRDAVARFESAMACLRSSSQTQPSVLAHVNMSLGQAFRAIGRVGEAMGCLEQAATHFLKLDQPVRSAEARLEIVWLSLLRGHYEKSEEELTIAESLLEKFPDDKQQGRAAHIRAELCLHSGDIDSIEALLEVARGYFNRGGDRAGLASVENTLGKLYHRRSTFQKARYAFRRAVQMRERQGDILGLATSLNHLGTVHEILGELMEAQLCQVRTLSIRRRLGNAFGVAITLVDQASVLRQRAFFGRSLLRLQEAEQLMEEIKSPWCLALVQGELARLWLAVGRYEESDRVFHVALESARSIEATILEGEILGDLALSLLNLDRQDEAEKALEEVLAMGAEHGSPEVEAEGLLGLVEVYLASGEVEEAQDLLEEAGWNEAVSRSPWYQVRVAILDGSAQLAKGSYDRALTRFDEAFERARQHDYWHQVWLASVSALMCLQGKYGGLVMDSGGNAFLSKLQRATDSLEELLSRIESEELIQELQKTQTVIIFREIQAQAMKVLQKRA